MKPEWVDEIEVMCRPHWGQHFSSSNGAQEQESGGAPVARPHYDELPALEYVIADLGCQANGLRIIIGYAKNAKIAGPLV